MATLSVSNLSKNWRLVAASIDRDRAGDGGGRCDLLTRDDHSRLGIDHPFRRHFFFTSTDLGLGPTSPSQFAVECYGLAPLALHSR